MRGPLEIWARSVAQGDTRLRPKTPLDESYDGLPKPSLSKEPASRRPWKAILRVARRGLRQRAVAVFEQLLVVATVAGFGWLVIAMGIAQCDTERKHIRACYVACFALIFFYREVPWARLLADWLVSV